MSELNLRPLEEAIAKLTRDPVWQAIAIYNCEATKDQVIQLSYEVPLEHVVKTFRHEAGPVVRWFFKSKPFELLSGSLPDYEPKPINRYGFAVVMSRQAFESLPKFEIKDSNKVILGPTVYDLHNE